MRLWSIHPTYLDTKGLVAVWREGLLALHVLRGQTKGYTRHPQLIRFQNHAEPLAAITNYLHAIVDEASVRSFNFDRTKLESLTEVELIQVTSGQVAYEVVHLMQKLAIRDPLRLTAQQSLSTFDPHPLFKIVPGEIEDWERVSSGR